jgi:hypothetical protein
LALDNRPIPGEDSPSTGALSRIADACRYCARREHFRRTIRIALVVGLLLSAINQGQTILTGMATAATAVRCVANFLIPFVVSNLGLLAGRAKGGA